MKKNLEKSNLASTESARWYENRLKHYFSQVNKQEAKKEIASNCSPELENFLAEIKLLKPLTEQEKTERLYSLQKKAS